MTEKATKAVPKKVPKDMEPVEVGKNLKISISGGILNIQIDLSQKGEESGSGKSIVIGSSGGKKPMPGVPKMEFMFNCYIKKA